MKPPATIDVLDQHGGYTAITKSGTLWRPGKILKKTKIGMLVRYDEGSFYQNNNDVTRAVYKVPGYAYKVAIWFDNKTHRRIA